MKKLIAYILLLCMLISCVACDRNDSSSSEESTKQTSTESQSESKTESAEELDTDNFSSSAESESTEISESEPESEQESTTESESESVVAPITEFGEFSSAITGVGSAYDRLRQMGLSKSVYNVGSGLTKDQLDAALSSAKKIKASGAIIGYSNASKLIGHFLENSGEDYEINVADFLKDENALTTRNEELAKALRAAEALAVEGESVNVYQTMELVHHNLTGDWKFALGSYFTSIEITDLTVDGNIYTATFTYNVTDFYNWEHSNSTPVFSGLAATLVGSVSPRDLNELHRAGLAQEFLSHGEISYTFSWAKGSAVNTIPALNK